MTSLDHLRILPILDTQEIFEQIGEEWAHPGDTRRHGSRGVDRHFVEWIYFCEEARHGYELMDRMMHEHLVIGDENHIDAYSAFSRSLEGEIVKYPKIITNIESAFAQVLSKYGKEIIAEQHIHPKKVKVDDVLRGQVKKLIWGMEPLTDIAVNSKRSKLHTSYLD